MIHPNVLEYINYYDNVIAKVNRNLLQQLHNYKITRFSSYEYYFSSFCKTRISLSINLSLQFVSLLEENNHVPFIHIIV